VLIRYRITDVTVWRNRGVTTCSKIIGSPEVTCA
jgi:hypothetical protein